MKEQLIEKLEKGTYTEEDLRIVEEMIASGEIDPLEVPSYRKIMEQFNMMAIPEPSERMSEKFYAMLNEGQKDLKQERLKLPIFNSVIQIAAAVLLLALGFAAGNMYTNKNTNNDLRNLSEQVTEMKEMMMLTMLEQESTSERLKAVNIVNEMPSASSRITSALLSTLRKDPNANVRMAALEALIPYTNEASVRKGLVEAISEQDSPLVVLAISELMAAIQEKAAIDELKKILKDQPEEIKTQIQNNINTLI